MNRAEQFCQTIKRMSQNFAAILPPEYQQVEYIATTSGCYIVTSVTNTTPIEFETEAKSYNNTGGYVFGTTTNPPRYFLQLFTGAGKTAIGYNNYTTGGTVTDNVYYKLSGIIHNGEQKLYIDGVQDISAAMTGTLSQAYIRLFGVPEHPLRGEMRYFRITSNGTPLFNGIPCYRKSDNRAGMYDTINNQFIDSPTLSNFTVGQDV